MRRIENMKTLSIHRAALDRTARLAGSTLTIHPEPRRGTAANNNAAIERQLDEIQSTFGVRWEW
jgi:hypothetical protein